MICLVQVEVKEALVQQVSKKYSYILDMTLKYNILAIFFGIVSKLYDDLYDNQILETNHISDIKREYIYEFLKTSTIASFVLLVTQYPDIVIPIGVLWLVPTILDSKQCGYGFLNFIDNDDISKLPYETSAFLALTLIILTCLPVWNFYKDDGVLFFSISILLFYCARLFIVNYIDNEKEKELEYSWKKIYYRFILLCVSISLIFINDFFELSRSMNMFFYTFTGYFSVSVIMQSLLIKNIIKGKY